jgi:WD40 repeat protein
MKIINVYLVVVCFFTITSCQKSGSYKWYFHDIISMGLMPNESVLVADKNDLLLWNSKNGETKNVPIDLKDISKFSSSEDGLIAIIGKEKKLKVFSLTDNWGDKEYETLGFAHYLIFKKDLLLINQSGHGPLLFKVNRQAKELVPVSLNGYEEISSSFEVAIDEKKKFLAASILFESKLFSPKYGLSLWNREGNIIWQKNDEFDFANGLDFSPNGELLVYAGKGGYLKLRRVSDGEVLNSKRHNRGFTEVKFLPDGLHFVTGDFSGKLTFWETNTLKEIKVIEIGDVNFLQIQIIDCKRVVIASSNGNIQIINPEIECRN